MDKITVFIKINKFYLYTENLWKYLFFNQKATFTKMIKKGTSTKGPITPANACPLLIPKTPMETAIANSKLLPEAVNDNATASR